MCLCQDFLLTALREAQNEVVQHGACLGLGIAALGTESLEIVELIKNTLYSGNPRISCRRPDQKRVC